MTTVIPHPGAALLRNVLARGGLKPGMRFEHARVIDSTTKQPAVCVVTAIRDDLVYWRLESAAKSKDYFPLAQTDKYVKRILPLVISVDVRQDLQFENHGSIWLVRPITEAGTRFLSETAPDDAQFMGEAMAVEPRYVEGVVNAAREYGLTI